MANVFLFGLYFGENKAHFFPEHSKTKSVAYSVYTHYFSKAPARTGKGGGKKDGGGCECMHASSAAQGKTQQISKIMVLQIRSSYQTKACSTQQIKQPKI